MNDAEIKVQVDLDALNEMPIEVLDSFTRAAQGKLTGSELLDLLDGLVVGGVRGRGYKLKDLQLLSQAISDAVKAEAQGETSAGA